MKAKIDGVEIAQYPYTLADLRRDNPNTMFPSNFDEWDTVGVVDVMPTPAPEGQVAEEQPPALIDGAWVQQWSTRPYNPDELEQQRSAKSRSITADFTAACNTIRTGYSADEIQSWPQQQTQAEAYTADNTAPVPLLDAMATARGISKAELAARILTNAAAYSTAYGTALGIKQARQEALAAIDLAAPDAAEQIEAL